MAKFKTVDTKAMLQAGATGSQAELRASQRRTDAEERRTAQTQQGLARGAQMLQQEGARRDELAQRKEKLAGQMKQGQQQLDLQKRGQDIQAAKAGLMERPSADGTAQAQPGQAQPGQEQDQGPTEQERKPLEMGPGGRFVSTPEAQAARTAAGGVARAKQATALQNAQTASLNARTAYQRAKNAGKLEAMKLAHKADVSAMATVTSKINDLEQEKIPARNVLLGMKGNPKADDALKKGPEEQLIAAIQLTKAQRDNMGLGYTETYGEFPPHWGDPHSETVKRYNAMAPVIASTLDRAGAMFAGQEGGELAEATGDEIAQLQRAWRGFTSEDDKQRFIRQTTARIMREVVEIQRERGVEAKASGFQQLMQEKDEIIADQAAKLAAYAAAGMQPAGTGVQLVSKPSEAELPGKPDVNIPGAGR